MCLNCALERRIYFRAKNSNENIMFSFSGSIRNAILCITVHGIRQTLTSRGRPLARRRKYREIQRSPRMRFMYALPRSRSICATMERSPKNPRKTASVSRIR